MISEDESGQNSQPEHFLPQQDQQRKSRSLQYDQRVHQISQDHMISKNESEQSNYHSYEEEGEHLAQNEQKSQFGNLLIKFPKNYSRTQNDIGDPSIQAKQKLPLEMVYPWLSEKTRSIENPLIKLHNEIIDFFLTFQQCQETHNELLFTFNKLQGMLFKTFKNCDVLAPFFTNRVYLKNSEVQIFILFDPLSWKSTETIEKVKQCLEKMGFEQIRFFETQPQEGRQHKIGFNCVTSEKNYPLQIKLVTQEWISYLSMINDLLENNLESKYLQLIFDTMIKQRGLQNSVKGYFLFGLISVFLQERKRQKSRSLTQNLLKFLEYFGVGPFTQRRITYVGRNEFEITQDYQLNSSGYPQFSFWIGPTIDISNHMAKEFFSLLKNRYRLISNFNFSHSESILGALINSIYDEFRY